MEIWKTIEGFEGIYEISDYGNVKSLNRIDRIGRNKKGVILKFIIDADGYCRVNLYNYSVSSKCYHMQVHQLVAIAFLNHKPCGAELVINHKDFNKQNNHKYNLEITTTRINSDRKHLKSTSKYTGVSWKKKLNKWTAQITANKKVNYLGVFNSEYDAHLAYQKALSDHLNKETTLN